MLQKYLVHWISRNFFQNFSAVAWLCDGAAYTMQFSLHASIAINCIPRARKNSKWERHGNCVAQFYGVIYIQKQTLFLHLKMAKNVTNVSGPTLTLKKWQIKSRALQICEACAQNPCCRWFTCPSMILREKQQFCSLRSFKAYRKLSGVILFYIRGIMPSKSIPHIICIMS